jgi:hypothetical protein
MLLAFASARTSPLAYPQSCRHVARGLPCGRLPFLFAFKAHRLANPRTITLELIEVKVGDYLGDDIERLTD